MDLEIQLNTPEGLKSELIHIDDSIYNDIIEYSKKHNCSEEEVLNMLLYMELSNIITEEG